MPRQGVTARGEARTSPMGRVGVTLALMAAVLAGCAMTPEERAAAQRAWAARDAERAADCSRRGGIWVGGVGGSCTLEHW